MSPELKTRTLSAVIIGAAVIFITFWHEISFGTMVVFGGLILWREWRDLTRMRSKIFIPLGLLYISAAVVGLMYMRHQNINILLAVFAIVWTGDIAAYLVGRKLGKHKIAPSISPGKSWEGLVGSIVASAAVATGIAAAAHVPLLPHAILGAVLAIIGLGGDLFESALKRRAGVKDSGTLIPGHGGLFDRVDALLPCAIVSAIALYIRLNFS